MIRLTESEMRLAVRVAEKSTHPAREIAGLIDRLRKYVKPEGMEDFVRALVRMAEKDRVSLAKVYGVFEKEVTRFLLEEGIQSKIAELESMPGMN